MPAATHNRNSLGLPDLFSPLPVGDFFKHWFDKKPLLIRGHKDKFNHLPSLEEVLRTIETGLPWCLERRPEMYLDGLKVPDADIHATSINMDQDASIRPHIPRYEKLMQHGATLALYGMHRVFAALYDVVSTLSNETGAEAQAHIFLSQQGCQGLAPHYDCVEIFVVQLSGHKRWQVSSQRATNPIAGRGAALTFDETAPQQTFELGLGDLLYLPRGTFHYALTTSAHSLHTSIALAFTTGCDLVSALNKACVEEPWLRAYLHPHSKTLTREQQQLLAERIKELVLSDRFIEIFEDLRLQQRQLAGPSLEM